jgi:CubicO group peptidase (beta-lactamase class C family)
MKSTFQPIRVFLLLLPVFLYLLFASATCKKVVFDKPSNISPVPLTAAAITDLVEQEMALQNIVGIAVGTVENGVVKHTLAFGHLDESRTLPVTTNTLFRYASLSKPVTALAAFHAISDGHLELNRKIGDYVSYWPSDGNKDDITVAHCLSHRSGIVHYGRDASDNMVCTPSSVATPANSGFNGQRSVERFDQCDLLSAPGTAHRYSSYAYDLLGAAIEEAVNMDYVAYVNKHIKDVAGLSSLSAFADSPGGFDYDCKLRRVAKNEGNTTIKIPGGGWSSNVRDLARLMQGIVNDEFIPSSYALWQDVSFSSGNSNYVYGFKKKTVDGATYAYHGGAHDDVRTFMGFFPGD